MPRSVLEGPVPVPTRCMSHTCVAAQAHTQGCSYTQEVRMRPPLPLCTEGSAAQAAGRSCQPAPADGTYCYGQWPTTTTTTTTTHHHITHHHMMRALCRAGVHDPQAHKANHMRSCVSVCGCARVHDCRLCVPGTRLRKLPQRRSSQTEPRSPTHPPHRGPALALVCVQPIPCARGRPLPAPGPRGQCRTRPPGGLPHTHARTRVRQAGAPQLERGGSVERA